MLSFHQIDKFWVKSVHFWGVTENVEPPIFHWKIKTVPAVSLSSPDELDKYHYNIYLREKWHLPASLAPGCITQPPFCLHFRWKYLHCWTEELELRQWILILLLPQDKPAVPCAVEKADCATPAEGWRWSHHLLISQSWPVERAWNLNEPPDTTMAEAGSCGEGGGGVRRAYKWSLGHLSESGRAPRLSRSSWVTKGCFHSHKEESSHLVTQFL